MRCAFLPVCLLAFASFIVARPPEDAMAQGPPPAVVVTASVVQETFRAPRILVGTAEPRYQAAIAAEVRGLVTELKVRRGDQVPKGAEIVVLRTLPVKLELQESLARLSEIQARIDKAEADMKRAEDLFARSFISEEELQTRRTQLDAFRRQAEQVSARIRIQRDRLRRMTVKAPFSGQIVEERTEAGQWLGEGDPVILLADLSVMHIMVPVPERQIPAIALGDEVEVRFDALPEEIFSGEVSAIIPRADPASRTFPVQVSIENPDNRVLAGMLARVAFFTGPPETATLVPKDAFVPRPEGGGYIVKIDEGRAVLVDVDVRGTHGDRYAVEPIGEENLSAGDRVVIRGNERLRPEQNVREARSPAGEENGPGSRR